MKMKKTVLVILVILLLSTSQPIQAQTYDVEDPSSLDFFSPIYERIVMDNGGIIRDIARQSDSQISTARDSGLALVTLMKLYDLYNKDEFLSYAKDVSNYLTTALQDPRYQLFATYYDDSTGITSNFRSSIDNFLIAWGLEQLANRIDPKDALGVKIQEERVDFIRDDIDLFLRDTGILQQFRIDTESISQPSSIYNVYSNLFNAFILSESNSIIFNEFEEKPTEIFEYIQANATSEDGGIYSIVLNGFTDNVITLTNTALFANLALNLYKNTNQLEYLNVANSTMQYIQDTFYDIGVTGGYFETVIDGAPVQQSKSLFSHALLLNVLMGLANQGDNDARLNLLALWRTITQYFRDGYRFYSTIDRGGQSASGVISTEDNLMMIYAMSSLPLFSKVNYTEQIEFRDKINLDITLQVPPNIQSELVIYVDAEEERSINVTGGNELQTLNIELDPKRPSSGSEEFQFDVILQSEGVETDRISFQIEVELAPGANISPGVITVVSIIAITIFALFVRNYDELESEEKNE